MRLHVSTLGAQCYAVHKLEVAFFCGQEVAMKFGVFYEHQYPRPWTENGEATLLHEALDQVELADKLGIDYAWEVEHHFLEEYSHSSAPEVFLGAASQRTSQIRLGHGITLMPPGYNAPARIAERISTLDLLSNGRVEFGTGESASRTELEGYNVDPTSKRAQWEEAVEQVTNMMVMDPYPGYNGEFFSMPTRNVVPKPLQKPHPPLWVACSSRETIKMAARHGIGALTFSFVDADEAKPWVDDYYDTFKNECIPIGHAVNPNIAFVMGFSLHQDEQVAIERGIDGLRFFQYALGHYYVQGKHQPGRTNIWDNYMDVRSGIVAPDLTGGGEKGNITASRGAIGTPDQVRSNLRAFADLGVDQSIFIQQGGKNKHSDICDSLNLFAKEVMPEFHAEEDARLQIKNEELAPFIQEAFDRKVPLAPLTDDQIPVLEPYGKV